MKRVLVRLTLAVALVAGLSTPAHSAPAVHYGTQCVIHTHGSNQYKACAKLNVDDAFPVLVEGLGEFVKDRSSYCCVTQVYIQDVRLFFDAPPAVLDENLNAWYSGSAFFSKSTDWWNYGTGWGWSSIRYSLLWPDGTYSTVYTENSKKVWFDG